MKFENKMREALASMEFFMFCNFGSDCAIKCVDIERAIWISLIAYKKVDDYDRQFGHTGELQQVYWLQFRNNRAGRWDVYSEFFNYYIYSVNELQSFINDWQNKFDSSVGMDNQDETGRWAMC